MNERYTTARGPSDVNLIYLIFRILDKVHYRKLGFSANLELIHLLLRKLAHVVIYLGFGGLLYHTFACTWTKWSCRMLGISFLLCTAIASIDELQKAFIPGRHCDPKEILLNCIAALLGNLIAHTWTLRHCRK